MTEVYFRLLLFSFKVQILHTNANQDESVCDSQNSMFKNRTHSRETYGIYNYKLNIMKKTAT